MPLIYSCGKNKTAGFPAVLRNSLLYKELRLLAQSKNGTDTTFNRRNYAAYPLV